MGDLSKFIIDGQTANVKDATARQLIEDLQNSMFPVGYILHCSDCDTEAKVIAKYGGTHWVNITGRVIVGADSTYAQGTTGGSADSVVVAHTHTNEAHTHTQNAHNHTQNAHTHTQNAHTHIQNAHTHTQNAHTHTASSNETGAHTHKINSTTGDASGAWFNGLTFGQNNQSTSESAGAHSHAITVNSQTATNQNATATNQNTTATNQSTTATNNSATATNNTATITINSAGVSGTGKNMMPYIAEYIWERIS